MTALFHFIGLVIIDIIVCGFSASLMGVALMFVALEINEYITAGQNYNDERTPATLLGLFIGAYIGFCVSILWLYFGLSAGAVLIDMLGFVALVAAFLIIYRCTLRRHFVRTKRIDHRFR